jgi:hypothetical protein
MMTWRASASERRTFWPRRSRRALQARTQACSRRGTMPHRARPLYWSAAAARAAAPQAPPCAVKRRRCVCSAHAGDPPLPGVAAVRVRWQHETRPPPPPPGRLPSPPPLQRARPGPVPDAPPPSAAAVAALSEFVSHSQRLLVITGAGISTESGVPDYRSPGGAYRCALLLVASASLAWVAPGPVSVDSCVGCARAQHGA